MNSNHSIGKRPWHSLNLWLFIAFTLTYVIYFCCTPRYLDDIWFATEIRDWREGVYGASLWEGITSKWVTLITYDNVRITNILCIPALALPKWVGSGLLAILWGISCWWGTTLAGVSTLKSPLVVVALFMFSFLMPWYDNMAVEDFQFNYILPSFTSLLVLKIFLNCKVGNEKRNYLLFLLIGFILGILHEGFTLSLLVITMYLYIYSSIYHTHKNLMLITGLAAAMVWFLSSPCLWSRFERERNFDSLLTHDFINQLLLTIKYVATQNIAFFVSGILIAAVGINKKLRSVLKDRFILSLVAGILASLALQIVVANTPRSSWWGNICSIMLILRLSSVLFKDFSKKYTAKSYLLCLPLILILFARQITIDYYSIKTKIAYEAAINEYLQTGKETIFADQIAENKASWLCLSSVNFNILQNALNNYFLRVYYRIPEDRTINFIPNALRKVTQTSGRKLTPMPDGNDVNVRDVDGWLFMPFNESYFPNMVASADIGYMQKQAILVNTAKFISEADGRQYLLVSPQRNVIIKCFDHYKSFSPVNVN